MPFTGTGDRGRGPGADPRRSGRASTRAGSGPTMRRSSSSAICRSPSSSPLLEARFGTWQRAGGAARAPRSSTPRSPAPRPRIVLIDRPQSPQSLILAGAGAAGSRAPTICSTSSPPTRCSAATSSPRINMDLRETTRLVLWRARRASAASSIRCPTSSRRRSRPTTPAIRSPRRCEHGARLPGDQGRHSRELQRVIAGNTAPAARPVRDLGRGARRAALERALPPSRQLLGDARRPLSRR